MTDTIVLERTLAASLEEVWRLWTTKEGFESWWGPEGFHVEVHELDPRRGGHIVYDMIAHGQEQIEAMEAAGQPTRIRQRMRFAEVTPHTGLVITSVIDFAGVESYESDLDLRLRLVGPRVHMTLTLQAMHDEQWTRMAIAGWKSQLNKLPGALHRNPA